MHKDFRVHQQDLVWRQVWYNRTKVKNHFWCIYALPISVYVLLILICTYSLQIIYLFIHLEILPGYVNVIRFCRSFATYLKSLLTHNINNFKSFYDIPNVRHYQCNPSSTDMRTLLHAPTKPFLVRRILVCKTSRSVPDKKLIVIRIEKCSTYNIPH